MQTPKQDHDLNIVRKIVEKHMQESFDNAYNEITDIFGHGGYTQYFLIALIELFGDI